MKYRIIIAINDIEADSPEAAFGVALVTNLENANINLLEVREA